MPNYCECDLFIHGEPDDLLAFVAGLKKDEKGKFSILRSYAPMPSELEHTISPTVVVADEDARREYMKGRWSPDEAHPITRDEQIKFLTEYHADNWYDWSNQNWGTKWGDFDTKYLKEVDNEPGNVALTFRTAWNPPEEGMLSVVSQFPSLKFSLYYYECGMEQQGGYEYEDGKLATTWRSAYHGIRGG